MHENGCFTTPMSHSIGNVHSLELFVFTNNFADGLRFLEKYLAYFSSGSPQNLSVDTLNFQGKKLGQSEVFDAARRRTAKDIMVVRDENVICPII